MPKVPQGFTSMCKGLHKHISIYYFWQKCDDCLSLFFNLRWIRFPNEFLGEYDSTTTTLRLFQKLLLAGHCQAGWTNKFSSIGVRCILQTPDGEEHQETCDQPLLHGCVGRLLGEWHYLLLFAGKHKPPGSAMRFEPVQLSKDDLQELGIPLAGITIYIYVLILLIFIHFIQ